MKEVRQCVRIIDASSTGTIIVFLTCSSCSTSWSATTCGPIKHILLTGLSVMTFLKDVMLISWRHWFLKVKCKLNRQHGSSDEVFSSQESVGSGDGWYGRHCSLSLAPSRAAPASYLQIVPIPTAFPVHRSTVPHSLKKALSIFKQLYYLSCGSQSACVSRCKTSLVNCPLKHMFLYLSIWRRFRLSYLASLCVPMPSCR